MTVSFNISIGIVAMGFTDDRYHSLIEYDCDGDKQTVEFGVDLT